MLVLSRHRDESIIIGEPGPNQVVITIMEIRGDKVRLGIEADRVIPVHREEVYNSIQNSKLENTKTERPNGC